MKSLGGWFKDLLFPKFCVSCNHEDVWLCDRCAKVTLEKEKLPQEKMSLTTPNADKVIALFHFGENNISALIKMLKYNSLSEIGVEFEKIIAGVELALPLQDFVIIPVPLHVRRERERGFNQAAILAQVFAKKFDLKVGSQLQRSIYTKQQATLSAAERSVNLREAFIYNHGNEPVPEKVLLVDDVYTTGATMDECAKVLKQQGVQTVWGLALAHGG